MKLPSLDPATRATMHALGSYERELRFYERLARSTHVRTPHCYFAARAAEPGGFVFLLDEVQGEPGIPTLQALEQALCEIAALHARYWQAPELADLAWLEHSPAIGALIEQQLAPVPERVVARAVLRCHRRLQRRSRSAARTCAGCRTWSARARARSCTATCTRGRSSPAPTGRWIFDWQTAAMGFRLAGTSRE